MAEESHLEDIALLREKVPSLKQAEITLSQSGITLNDDAVESLYQQYCTDEYCANWMILKQPKSFELFDKWLREVKVGTLIG